MNRFDRALSQGNMPNPTVNKSLIDQITTNYYNPEKPANYYLFGEFSDVIKQAPGRFEIWMRFVVYRRK